MQKTTTKILNIIFFSFTLFTQACGGGEGGSSAANRTIAPTPTPSGNNSVSPLKVSVGKLQYRPTGPEDPKWQSTSAESEFTAGSDTSGKVVAVTICNLQDALPEQVRPWIGHSTGASTNPGYSKTQVFKMPPLKIDRDYELRIFPLGSVGIVPYVAKIQAGNAEFLDGQSYVSADKLDSFMYSPQSEVWKIRFKALSTDVSIEVGNFLKSGLNYMYFDYIEFEEV